MRDSHIQSYPYKHIRDTYVTLGWISTHEFLAPHIITHVNFNHVNKIETRAERVFTFTLTCDLSYIASILFLNVNFTQVRT